jgi:hypothetical protein
MAIYIRSPIRLHGVVLNYLSTRTTLPFYFFIFFFGGQKSSYLMVPISGKGEMTAINEINIK